MTPKAAAQTECRHVPGQYDAELDSFSFPRCIGPKCQSWRWLPFAVTPEWIAAVQTAAKELGDNTPGRSKAAAHVNENRKKYGLPDKPFSGYCGQDSKPEVVE